MLLIVKIGSKRGQRKEGWRENEKQMVGLHTSLSQKAII